MLHMMLRQFITFKCDAFTVLSYTVLFPALVHLCTGQGQVSSPSEPSVALVGDGVTLPCRLDPATDASQLTVEWARSDLDPRFVLVWRDGIELESKKHPSYRNRTSVSPENLKLGDTSLSLSSVRLSDEGTYRCFVPPLRDTLVQLVVGAASSPVITTIDDEQSGGVVLQCNSSGWYPEPEVLWLDDEGDLVSAGHADTQTVRGPDDLFSLSSTLTVDKKQQNITCRIQQKSIAQTRDTYVQVPGHSSSSAPLLVAVIALILLGIAVAFIVQKCKLKNKKKNQGDVESQKGEEKNNCPENTPLMKAETDGGKCSEKVENERTNTQEERRQQGLEEQETVQNQVNHVLVHTDRQSVTDGAELQTGTQQQGHTSDGNVENGDAESDGNMGGDQPKDPPEKQDEDKTQEDPEVQGRSEETGAQVQPEEENRAEKEEETADEKLEPLKNKLQQVERQKKTGEDRISKKNENIKDQENQLNELQKQLEEVERRLQENDVSNKTEQERKDTKKDLEKKKEEVQKKIQKFEKALERNQRERTHVETRKLKLEKEQSEIMTNVEKQKQRTEDEEEDKDEDL